MHFPPWLKKGDKINLLATSGRIDPAISEAAAHQLRSKGYEVELMPTATSSHHYFSGTPQQRWQDLQKAISDPKCKAILCVRGGFGAIHLLDKLDWSNFHASPKWLVGFSDITLLHAALQKQGIASIHGAMAKDFAAQNSDADAALKYLQGNVNGVQWNAPAFSTGHAEGTLVGGNLTLLTSLLGSPWEPDWKGKILFLEDIGEYLYKIDRMLWTLKHRGVFNQVAGVVLGYFSDISDTKVPYGLSLNEVFKQFFLPFNIPVVAGFPAGHETPNTPLMLGAHVSLQVQAEVSSLTYKR